MRNVIFPTFSLARCEGRTFLESTAMWGWRIHPWMNRRYDWAIIPRQGTRNFRNKEVGATRRDGPTDDETCIRSASTCTECMSSWMRFVKIPLLWGPSNETFNNFPRRNGRRPSIPSLLRREYSTRQDSTREEESYEVLGFDHMIIKYL